MNIKHYDIDYRSKKLLLNKVRQTSVIGNKKENKMDSKYYELRYHFSSQLDDIEGNRYITTYKVKIYESNYEKDDRIQIGKLTCKLLHVGLASNVGFPLNEIIDMEEYTFRIGQVFLDLENYVLNESIQKFYDYAFTNPDICLLTRFEIQESHRRKGIGRKVVKDIYNRFNLSCGLFVVQAFPLQFDQELESSESGELPEWSKKMNYASLENDFEKAFYQLKSFYQKIGFDHIEGFNELMFLNPSFINEKMDKIRLE